MASNSKAESAGEADSLSHIHCCCRFHDSVSRQTSSEVHSLNIELTRDRYLVLAIIGDIGYGCMKISPKQYIGIYVAVDVTQSIANLLVLFLLLFPLTMTLLRHNFFKVQLPRAVNGTFLLAATVLCFSQMGVTSYDALRSPERKHQKSRLEAPLTAAYVSTYLAGAALVTIYIIISIRTMCKYPTEYNAVCPFPAFIGGAAVTDFFQQHLKWTLPMLSFSIFSLALVNFVEGIGWTVAHAQWTKAWSVVFLVLNLLAQAITFETLLMVSGSDKFSAAGEKRGLAQTVLFAGKTGTGLDKQREWEMGAQRVKTDDGFMDRTRERSERTNLAGMPRDPASP